MGRIMTTRDEWQSKDSDALLDAILALRDRSELQMFFRDLFTLRELEEMTHRWAVVRLLARGLPYRQIAAEAGSSTATVTRINQWLHHGAGGYKLVLDRLGLGEEE